MWPPFAKLRGGPRNAGPPFLVQAISTGSGNPRSEFNIRTGAYAWTAGVGGTAEFYLNIAGATPVIASPNSLIINGVPAVKGSAIGSLAAGQWQYGDNDTLGFNTVYVRLSDGTDPDTKADGFIRAMI